MNNDQRRHVHRILSASLSSQGYLKATGIMHLDNLINSYYDSLYYQKQFDDNTYTFIKTLKWSHKNFYFAFFGNPADTNWGYNGAIRYEIMYLWWLRAQGSGVSPALRASARTRANVLLGNNFCQGNPTRATVFGAGVSNPNGLFQVPWLSDHFRDSRFGRMKLSGYDLQAVWKWSNCPSFIDVALDYTGRGPNLPSSVFFLFLQAPKARSQNNRCLRVFLFSCLCAFVAFFSASALSFEKKGLWPRGV